MRRRTFIYATLGITGALALGWCAMPPRQRVTGTVRRALGAGDVAINAWLTLKRDGSIGLVMPKSEMGQGVHTGLAMLVAEELDCPLASVRIDPAPVDRLYGNVIGMAEAIPFRADDDGAIARLARWTAPKVMREIGFMMTGGSSSVRDLWEPLREAAAMLRATLVDAAAKQWSVPSGEISIAAGVLQHSSGKRLGFGELLAAADGRMTPAERFTSKAPRDFTLIGRAALRIDSPSKVDGSAVFGIDVRRPGMRYAALRHCPTRLGDVATFDGGEAAKLPGVVKILRVASTHGSTGAIAVVADSYWRALRALEAVKVEWTPGPLAGVTSAAIAQQLTTATQTDDGFAYWKRGDVAAALDASVKRLIAEYTAPYLAHATLEPMNCTIEVRTDSAEVWAPTQVPDFARNAVAEIAEVPKDSVTMNVTYLGGGFGRRLEVDAIAQATVVARELRGTPVQVRWTREDDTRHDFYRPACASRFEAGLDDAGCLLAWRNVSASQAIVPQYMPRNAGLASVGPDKTTAEGAFDAAYEFPAAIVRHVAIDLPVPVGFWRSVGHSHQAFFKECFLDECAHAAGADPVEYRRRLLTNKPRPRAVLDLAASKANWNTPPPFAADGTRIGRGVALHESFGSIVAHVAEVSVDAAGAIRVHRVVCAIDCGLPVNPNLIAQQMESNVVFGLSAALFGRIDIDRGQVQASNFHDQQIVRLEWAPLVETHIVPSAEPLGGVGEPGLPPIAPAVANALFVLTGKRLRSLPLELTT